jgi:monoamine oxidase
MEMSKMAEQVTEVDVVIVGAGFAGLAAADKLRAINVRRSEHGLNPIRFVVLEGAARAGGRTFTQHSNLGYLEMGGQYLCPKDMDPRKGGKPQSAMYELVQRFGIEVFNTHLPNDRNHVYQSGNGSRFTFRGNYPNENAPEVVALVETVETMVRSMSHYLGRPWLYPQAELLDSQSVEQWVAGNIADPAMAELFAIAIRSAFSAEPKDVSVLHFLHYAASCGSFAAFEHVDGGGDAVRFRFGTGSLVKALTDSLGAGAVQFGRKVLEIRQDASGSSVVTQVAGGNETWLAQRVVVAMSPGASAKIRFTPGLSQARQKLVAGMQMANTIKGFAVFKTPWWRKDFSGYVLSAAGPAGWLMDNTWEDPRQQLGQASLMTFIVGQFAIEWGNQNRTPEQRRDGVLEQIGTLFNAHDTVKAELVQYVDWDWGSDQWGQGCPAGCAAPRVLTQLVDGRPVGESLYQAFGRVHWAGSETGLAWMGGYMNGAVDSGQRVAEEVAAFIP